MYGCEVVESERVYHSMCWYKVRGSEGKGIAACMDYEVRKSECKAMTACTGVKWDRVSVSISQYVLV